MHRLVRRAPRASMNAAEPLRLAHPAGVDQAEVGDDRMHQHAVPGHRHVQQAALLEAVVGDVVVADVADRPAREQRVAVLAVARDGVGAVGDLVAVGREVVGLRHLRPADLGVGEVARRGAVHAPHFLQEHEVGVERLDAEHEVVDLEALPRADAAHALVDVVGGDAQDVAGGAGSCGRCACVGSAEQIGAPSQARAAPARGAAAAGSPRRSTARSSGRRRRASRATRSAGARAARAGPAMSRGTRRPKTCSVLRVTPSA